MISGIHHGIRREAAPVLLWHDSAGQVHDLGKQPRLTAGEVALKLKRSTEHVLRLVRRGELAPVFRPNSRCVEVPQCALEDYVRRNYTGGANQ